MMERELKQLEEQRLSQEIDDAKKKELRAEKKRKDSGGKQRKFRIQHILCLYVNLNIIIA